MKKIAGFLLVLLALGFLAVPYYNTLCKEIRLPGVPELQKEENANGNNVPESVDEETPDQLGVTESPEGEEPAETKEEPEKESVSKNTQSFSSPLNSLSACLMDADSGRVLYEKNGFQEMPMASTTKIMTLLVILENADLEGIVTVSKYASTMPDVQLGIMEGEQYYVRDLVYSLMLESHNDVAVALAEHVGGSVEEFCRMMTAKAKSLGAYHTSFQTPNGLDADGHYTTAADLALIGSYAVKNEKFVEITNTSTHSFSEITKGRGFTVSNKNRFLYMMDGAIGIKTGFTGKAGYCFVGALKKSDRTFVSVVLGCGWPPNKSLKWADTKALMDYGVEQYSRKELFDGNKQFDPLPVYGGKQTNIPLECTGELSLLMREDEEVHVDYQLVTELKAPVSDRTQAGSADYYIGDELVASFPVYTVGAVDAIDWNYCFHWAMGLLSSGGRYSGVEE